MSDGSEHRHSASCSSGQGGSLPSELHSRGTTPLSRSRVLITGGGGFIGSHLSYRLCGEASEVHATSRSAHRSIHGGPTWWQVDMADLSAARRVFAAVKPDIVYHLAGSVGAAPDRNLVFTTYHSLLTSTVNVLMCATDAQCSRVILSGSFTEPPPGESRAMPSSPYAAAKWAASGYGRMFHRLFGTPVVILMPFMVYGPGQSPTKLVPSVAQAMLRGQAPMVSSGRRMADWVYVSDVIDGFVSAAVTPAIDGETIDLGSGCLISIRQVVEMLAFIIQPNCRPVFGGVPDRPGENEIAANVVSASTLLGWAATIPLESGLRRTVDWLRHSADPQGV